MKTASITSALKLSRVIGLAACLAFVPSASAQDAANAASPDDVKQLLRRIDQLEAKVEQLEEKQAVPAVAVVAAPVAPPPEPALAVDMPTVNEVAPRLKMIVFGDVGAESYTHSPDTFLFGSLDIFMRARLSDKVSVLGEVLFIAQGDNVIQPDVERLFLKYRQNDYFSVSVGRIHSSVGYYNTAFNYAQFLQTTTDRPFIYAFDDSGGVLPMQEVGVNVAGKIPSGKLGLHYFMEVGNGRAWGPTAQPSQNNQDGNNSKSINGGLFVQPDKVPGLDLGFSLRYESDLTLPGPPRVNETIATAHVVFVNGKYEILNEGVLVRHVEPSGPVFQTSAFYTQFSRAFKAWRPYFRYQYFNAHDDDPVFIYASPSNYAPPYATSFIGRINGPAFGIRYDFCDYAALKFQYDRISLRGLDAQNGLTTQIAFSF
jgi:hypothetical protein